VRSSLALRLLVGAAVGAGCGSPTKQGAERQDCYPNGTCNAGLVCLSNVCVSPGGTAGAGGASGGGGSGGGNGSCLTAANHGSLGSVTAPAAVRDGTGFIDWALPLEPGAPPRDELDVALFEGHGVFKSGLAPGTFALTGDELNFETCGLCVLVYENIEADTSYRGVYMATSGTVTLTSVTGTLAGTAANLKFQHVNIDQTSTVSTPDPDNCRSAVDAVTFNVRIN
jgi:hypothetical protein